jgi:hypothetical protein
MSQFQTWPHKVEVDLRIFRREGDEEQDYRMIYSYSMDALTSVSLEEVMKLQQAGVKEIYELPE